MVVISAETAIGVTVHLPGGGPVLVRIARLPTVDEWSQVITQLQQCQPPDDVRTVCTSPITVTVYPSTVLSVQQWQTVLAALSPVQELHLSDGKTYVAPITNSRISCLADAK